MLLFLPPSNPGPLPCSSVITHSHLNILSDTRAYPLAPSPLSHTRTHSRSSPLSPSLRSAMWTRPHMPRAPLSRLAPPPSLVPCARPTARRASSPRLRRMQRVQQQGSGARCTCSGANHRVVAGRPRRRRRIDAGARPPPIALLLPSSSGREGRAAASLSEEGAHHYMHPRFWSFSSARQGRSLGSLGFAVARSLAESMRTRERLSVLAMCMWPFSLLSPFLHAAEVRGQQQ